MTEAVCFGVIAVLAFAGWGATLVAMTKASVSAANSHKILQAIVDREDTKVATLVERIERVRNRGAAPEQPQQRRTEREEPVNPLAHIFGGPAAPVSAFVGEQPDSDESLEVVS